MYRKEIGYRIADWLIKVQHWNCSTEQEYLKLELKRHWLDQKNKMDWQIFEYLILTEMSLSEIIQTNTKIIKRFLWSFIGWMQIYVLVPHFLTSQGKSDMCEGSQNCKKKVLINI